MRFLGLLSFLLCIAFVGQAELHRSLSLNDAVQIALGKNPALLEAREKNQQTEAGIKVAMANLFPTITVQVTGNQKKDTIRNSFALFDGNSYNQYGSNIHLNQTLFQVGTFSAVDYAEKSLQLTKLDEEIASRNLMTNVILAYYQIVLSARNVETLVKQQRFVKESLSVAQRRQKIGRGQLLDVLQIKTQVALLDAQISTARNQLQIAAANFANFLGSREFNEVQIKNSLEAPDIKEIDQGLNFKKYRIPEIEKDVVSLEQIESQKVVTLGQNLPNLSFTGDYTFASYKSSDLYTPESNSWSLGLQLTIPLFSGLSSIYQQKSLLSQQIQLEHDKKNVEDQMALQQVTNRKNLETARDSIITGIEALKLAVASTEEAKRNYSLATIDILQFLSVEQAYAQAEQSLNSYKYSYITALTNYYAASGQDMNQLVSVLERANR